MKSAPLKHEVPLVSLVSPAHIRKNIDKALSVPPDTSYTTVFDMEDSVPQDKKGEAIENTTHYLSQKESKPIWIRTNPISPSDGERTFKEDIDTFMEFIRQGTIEGLHIPKAKKPEDIDIIESNIGDLSVKYSIIIETLSALDKLDEILDAIKATRSAVGVSIGWEDFCEELEIVKPENIFDNPLLVGIASKIALKAKPRGLAVQDGVNRAFGKDAMKPLFKQTIKMSEIGVKGKMAIHPNQIPVIKEGFESVKWAKELIAHVKEEFGSVENYLKSPGPFNYNGTMGVVRVVNQALQILK